MTYEDLRKVNETLEATDIKGKNYVEVNQRIKAFRMLFPTGSIVTELLSNENGICVFRASIGYEDEGGYHVLATGTAYEKEGSTFINKTSYIENAETSAVGRALGMAGIGIDTSVASAEEVLNAMENQKPKAEVKETRKITQEEMGKLKLELLRTGILEETICKTYKIKDITELTDVMYLSAMKKLAKTADRTEA